jgi:hypothetical protein
MHAQSPARGTCELLQLPGSDQEELSAPVQVSVQVGGVPGARVKSCVAALPTPLLAVKVIEYEPVELAAGLPDSTPVEELKLTPEGSVPVSVIFGDGKPVVFTAKLPVVPTEKVVADAEVMAGPSSTVRAKSCVAALPTPLLAVKVAL